MRVIVADPQKTIECGICKANNDWIRRISVEGSSGLYCIKCDTLTVFEDIKTNTTYKAFKNEVDAIRSALSR